MERERNGGWGGSGSTNWGSGGTSTSWGSGGNSAGGWSSGSTGGWSGGWSGASGSSTGSLYDGMTPDQYRLYLVNLLNDAKDAQARLNSDLDRLQKELVEMKNHVVESRLAAIAARKKA